jgi:hypothetical protein
VREYLASLRLPDKWQAKALATLKGERKDKRYVSRQKHCLIGELKRARSLFVAGDMPRSEYRHHQARITRSLNNLPAPTSPDLWKPGPNENQSSGLKTDRLGRSYGWYTGPPR